MSEDASGEARSSRGSRRTSATRHARTHTHTPFALGGRTWVCAASIGSSCLGSLSSFLFVCLVEALRWGRGGPYTSLHTRATARARGCYLSYRQVRHHPGWGRRGRREGGGEESAAGKQRREGGGGEGGAACGREKEKKCPLHLCGCVKVLRSHLTKSSCRAQPLLRRHGSTQGLSSHRVWDARVRRRISEGAVRASIRQNMCEDAGRGREVRSTTLPVPRQAHTHTHKRTRKDTAPPCAHEKEGRRPMCSMGLQTRDLEKRAWVREQRGRVRRISC